MSFRRINPGPTSGTSSPRPAARLITLYDAPGQASQPWAPNVWRIRMILNYKQLPYRTAWVEFPDLESRLRSIGAPPSTVRQDGRPVYALPVIVDPGATPRSSPQILSNTTTIAEYLESKYPALAIYPLGSRALQSLFVHYVQEVFMQPLMAIMVPLSHQKLNDRSRSHFGGSARESTRPDHERAWVLVKEQFEFLAQVLEKNNGDGVAGGDGIVAMGHQVSYADFAVCAVLLWIEQMASPDKWIMVMQWNGGRWDRLRERCKEYMSVC